MKNVLNIPERFVNIRTLSHDNPITEARLLRLARFWINDDPLAVRAFDTIKGKEVILKIGMFLSREIEVLPSLHHWGIPEFGVSWDIGMLPNTPYLHFPLQGTSQDFVGDDHWGRVCQQGVQYERAVILVDKLVQVVQYIHSAGVVHGDLHSGNIRVRGTDVYVIDFSDSVRLSNDATLWTIQAREMESVQKLISKLKLATKG